MKIIIAGVGKFGKTLTEHLAKENHDIIVIDNKSSVINDVVNQFDVMGYCGNGASYTTQVNADVASADLLIATTSTDELNILCCLVAKKLGVKQTIARIRNSEYAMQAQLMGDVLGLSMTLNPDYDTAAEIFRILRFPSAIKVEPFANGRVDLVEIKVEKGSTLVNKSLIEIKNKYQVRILVCAVKRNDTVFIPNGDFILNENDYIYLTADNKEIAEAFRKLKIFKEKLSSTLIIGGSKIAANLASLLLDNGISVKIIERNKERCQELATLLPNALIINGDGTNNKVLLEEGIETVDSVVTLTGMDETNIIISSFAKSLNRHKVITKINHDHYNLILNSVGLDSIVSPRDIFANNIIRYVRGMENTRGSEFKTLYRLVDNRVEALEFFIPHATSYTSIPLKDLKIKENFLLACIIRENKVIIPSGKDTIEPYDSVVIVTTIPQIKDVSDILR